MQVSLVYNANVRNISIAFSISGSSLTLEPINPTGTHTHTPQTVVERHSAGLSLSVNKVRDVTTGNMSSWG